MKPMEHTRGELLPVFGAAAVAFTFSLAAAFDWPWWGLLVAVAAVAAALSLCGSSVKNMMVGGCASLFLAAAALGLVAGRASIPSVLASVEGFLANHATAVQAVAAIVMALFTVALWRATKAQAETTRVLKSLEEKRTEYEKAPLLAASEVEVKSNPGKYEINKEGAWVAVEDPAIKLTLKSLANIGRYGALIKRVELLGIGSSTSGIWRVFLREHFVIPIMPGARKDIPLVVTDRFLMSGIESFFSTFMEEGSSTKDGAAAQALVRLTLVYGGNASEESTLCFRMQVAKANNRDEGKKELSDEEKKGEYVLAAVPAKCPEGAV